MVLVIIPGWLVYKFGGYVLAFISSRFFGNNEV